MKSRILSLSSAAYLIVNTPLMASPLDGMTVLVEPLESSDGPVIVKIGVLGDPRDAEKVYRFTLKNRIRASLGDFPAQAIIQGKLPTILPKGVWVEMPDKNENSFSFVPLNEKFHPVASLIRIWSNFDEQNREEILTIPLDDADTRYKLLTAEDLRSFLSSKGIDPNTLEKKRNLFVRGGKALWEHFKLCRDLIAEIRAVKKDTRKI